MATQRFIPSSNNVSRAWAETFLRLMDRGVAELSPLVLTVDDMSEEVPVECASVRSVLDMHLNHLGLPSCHTVANTIFPQSLWNEQAQYRALFERFDRAWPQLRKCQANKRGTYFESDDVLPAERS